MTHPARIAPPKVRGRRTATSSSDESDGWSAFESEVVKPLFETIEPGAQVRVWVVGESTPAAVYAVALAFFSGAARRHHRGPLRVIASYADAGATEAARRRRVPQDVLDRLPRVWLTAAKEAVGDDDLAAWLRRRILFSTHRLLLDPPFVQLDAIIASHLGVLESPHGGRAVERLAFGLREGGALWLTDRAPVDSADFEPSGTSGHLYRRVRRHMRRSEIDALITEVIAAERLRVSEDLHDGVGQHLMAIGLALHRVRALAREGRDLEPMLERLDETIAAAREDLRAVARGGLPPVATSSDLAVALRDAAEDASRILQIPITVDADPDLGPLDTNVVHQLVRIAQEAIRNAAAGHAREITVSARRHLRQIRLGIRDDGDGLQNEHPYRRVGLGLRIMRHRAHTIGATLEFASGPHGTSIVCVF